MGALDWLESQGARRIDQAVAAAFLIASQVQIWTVGAYESPGLVAVGAVVAAIAIALRRRAPVAATIVVAVYSAGAFVAGFGGSHDDPSFPGASMVLDPDVTLLPAVTVLFVSYDLASHSELPRAVAGAGILFALFTVLTIAEQVEFQELLVVLCGISCAWLIGRRIRRRRRGAEALAERAAALEAEQDEREEAAIAAERERIARELHDIVANALGVIVVQASAERRVLPSDAESADQALRTIEITGRQALGELRRVVEILRADDPAAEPVSLPSMENIRELVERMRNAGLRTELQVAGEPAALPPGIDLSAYRIVQEALTNALKHAGKATATVSIQYGDRALELEIVDDGRGAQNGAARGHGLVGMRERAELFGGEFEAGTRPEGGFSVRARFPLATT
jgi:signal transduction histidine kinase